MGLQHSDPYVLRKSLGHIVNAASTLHLELFQMVAPLYVSGLLLRVTQIGVKACIDVTLYSKDNFDRCPMIHSWIILVPLD